jgi:hypothetical protein
VGSLPTAAFTKPILLRKKENPEKKRVKARAAINYKLSTQFRLVQTFPHSSI